MRTAVSLLDRANGAKTKEEMHQLVFEAADEIQRLESELETSRMQTRFTMKQLCAYPPLT
jgi:hypothetical protein